MKPMTVKYGDRKKEKVEILLRTGVFIEVIDLDTLLKDVEDYAPLLEIAEVSE